MEIPADLRYTKNHEWARAVKGVAVVGITDYAQSSLGDVVFIQLPEEGSRVAKGGAFSSVESVKAASDIYAPVSGEVIETNRVLEEHPELVNKSPYGDGWIAKIRMDDPAEADSLLASGAYEEVVRAEEASR